MDFNAWYSKNWENTINTGVGLYLYDDGIVGWR